MRWGCLNPWLVFSILLQAGCGRTPFDHTASSQLDSTGTGGIASQGGGTSGASSTANTITAKGGSGGTTLSLGGSGGATGSYGSGAGNSASGGCDPNKNDGTACVSTNLCASGTTIQPASGTTITVGGFDASRGGECSMATGSILANVRNRLVTANFPGVTFVLTGAPTLTPAYLATLDILVITSTSSNTAAITPLSQAEQEAVSAFIQGGGRFLISSDNPGFGGANTQNVNNSVLGPVGMTAGGTTLNGENSMQSTVAGSPLVLGRSGSWATIETNYPGTWLSTGNATVVAIVNGDPSLPALAQFNVGDLGPASARGVVIADRNALSDYGGFNIVMIDNIIDYLIPTVQQVTAATQANTCQSGVCAAGPATYCPPVDACHLARMCDPISGLCAPGGQALDGTPCANGSSCQGGVCRSK
jgi:hypothetical protein